MLSPADLQRAELQAWIAGMQVAGKTRGAPLHPASHTVKSKAIQALGGALRIAMETGQIRSNPAEQLKAGKPAKRVARFLEPAELKALAEASVWPSMIWMLGTGGYRASESLALTRTNVSNHLACLRGCGLVVATPEGRQTRYEIADPHLTRAIKSLLQVVVAYDDGAPCLDDECDVPLCCGPGASGEAIQ